MFHRSSTTPEDLSSDEHLGGNRQDIKDEEAEDVCVDKRAADLTTETTLPRRVVLVLQVFPLHTPHPPHTRFRQETAGRVDSAFCLLSKVLSDIFV